jgi:hypothetical protein
MTRTSLLFTMTGAGAFGSVLLAASGYAQSVASADRSVTSSRSAKVYEVVSSEKGDWK